MSKKPKGQAPWKVHRKRARAGLKAARGNQKRHATFQAWRYSDGKQHPVTVRKLDQP